MKGKQTVHIHFEIKKPEATCLILIKTFYTLIQVEIYMKNKSFTLMLIFMYNYVYAHQ